MALPTTAASAKCETAATCCGVEMPKPSAMGRLRELLEAADELLGVGGELGLRAGDADARDGVDEAARVLGDGAETLVGRGGRGEEDGREVVGAHDVEVLGGFFDDHVGEENAVGAGGLRGVRELGHAHADDGVEIAEEDDAGLRAQLADVEAGLEDVGEARAAGDGAFAGALDDGAVGERVAEWDAELDDVGAGVDGGDGHVARGGERRGRPR